MKITSNRPAATGPSAAQASARLPQLGEPTFEANGGRSYQVAFGGGQPTTISFNSGGWSKGEWSLSTKLDLNQLSGTYRSLLNKFSTTKNSGAEIYARDLDAVGAKLLEAARKDPALAEERIFGIDGKGAIEVLDRPGLADALRRDGLSIPVKLVKHAPAAARKDGWED